MQRLTKAQRKIMDILWNTEKPLSYSEICDINSELNVNTVQAELRRLLKFEYIKVGEIGYSGTVLCRSYLPTMTAEEFQTRCYIDEMEKLNKRPAVELVCGLLGAEKSNKQRLKDVAELEKMLEEYKKEIKE